MQRRHPLKPFTSPVMHQFTQRRGTFPYQLLCSHTQSVCAECMCVVLCVVLCFGAVWCVLMCCVVLCCVGSCRVVSWRCVRVRVRVCVCERVEECLVCGVMSCIINGPREQQSANSAIRRNSYDLPDPTLRHSRVSKFKRDSLSCVSLFVF